MSRVSPLVTFQRAIAKWQHHQLVAWALDILRHAVNAYGSESLPSELTVLLGEAAPVESEPSEYEAVDERVTSDPTIGKKIVPADMAESAEASVHQGIDERMTSNPVAGEAKFRARTPRLRSGSVQLRVIKGGHSGLWSGDTIP